VPSGTATPRIRRRPRQEPRHVHFPLDAGDVLTDERARKHHDTLRVAGFHPSLHLNLADDFRRLGSFRAAAEHLDRAQDHMSALPDDPYGETIRTAVHEVRQAITGRDTAPRASAPGTAH